MKLRIGQSLTLLIILSVACPAAAAGTDRGFTQGSGGDVLTPEDKAAAAERLANRAAELARQAAALAAESQRDAAPTTAGSAANAADRDSLLFGWTARESEAVYISDAPDQAKTESAARSGWRSPKNGSAGANILFRDDQPKVQRPQSAKPAEAKSPAKAPLGSEANTTEKQPLADRLPPPRQDADQLVLASASPTTKSAAISDKNVKLAARMLAEEEPLPAGLNDAPSATGPYNGDDQSQQPLVRPADYGARDNCASGCGDDCAGGCCETDCCPPRPVLFWTAGVEATFLNPDLNSEGTSFLVEETAYERSDWISTASDDIDSMYVSPRVWLGVQGCKWGANVRYWHLQAGEGSFDPSIGPVEDPWDWGSWLNTGYSSCNNLEAYTIDFEITRRFCYNDCWMQASAGIRHAEIWQDESIWGAAITDDSLLFGHARANRMSRGTGLVFGLYGRKPIFPCSCVNWFYNVRWSAMWGPTETSAETGVLLGVTNDDPGVVATAGSVNAASTTVDDNLFIGEIQLGVEWNYALQCLPANAFFRAAIEYQRWDGGLGYSSAFSFASVTVDDELTTYSETNAAAATPELDLVGITLGTGLTW